MAKKRGKRKSGVTSSVGVIIGSIILLADVPRVSYALFWNSTLYKNNTNLVNIMLYVGLSICLLGGAFSLYKNTRTALEYLRKIREKDLY